MINLLGSDSGEYTGVKETDKLFHRPFLVKEKTRKERDPDSMFSEIWDDSDSSEQDNSGLRDGDDFDIIFDYSEQAAPQPRQIKVSALDRFRALASVEKELSDRVIKTISSSGKTVAPLLNIKVDAAKPLYRAYHRSGEGCVICSARDKFRLCHRWKLTVNIKGESSFSFDTRWRQDYSRIFTAWAPDDVAHGWESTLPVIPVGLLTQYNDFIFLRHPNMSHGHYHVHFVRRGEFQYKDFTLSYCDALAIECLRRTVVCMEIHKMPDEPGELYMPIIKFYNNCTRVGRAALDVRADIMCNIPIPKLPIMYLIVRKMEQGLTHAYTYLSDSYPTPQVKSQCDVNVIGEVM